MKPFRLRVEIEEAETVRDLRKRLVDAEEKSKKDAYECRMAWMYTMHEQALNAELIELCRQHGIDIEDRLDFSNQQKRRSRQEFKCL